MEQKICKLILYQPNASNGRCVRVKLIWTNSSLGNCCSTRQLFE